MNNNLTPIEFRVWDNGFYSKNPKMLYFDMYEVLNFGLNVLKSGDSYCRPESDEIMLYTGLVDKNNKKIYRGDIVRIDWNDSRYLPTIGIVTWDSSEARFDFGGGTPSEVNWSHEVIGNIFEDAYLLNNSDERE